MDSKLHIMSKCGLEAFKSPSKGYIYIDKYRIFTSRCLVLLKGGLFFFLKKQTGVPITIKQRKVLCVLGKQQKVTLACHRPIN